MRLTCLFCFFLLAAISPLWAGHTPKTLIFLRVHVQTAGEGLSAQQATTLALPPDNENIQVRALPEATESDLIDVKVDAASQVRLFFNRRGTVNLSASTAQNQGRILVVLINGQVVYAPTIDEQITNGELDIPHPLNPDVIKLLQQTAAANAKEASRD